MPHQPDCRSLPEPPRSLKNRLLQRNPPIADLRATALRLPPTTQSRQTAASLPTRARCLRLPADRPGEVAEPVLHRRIGHLRGDLDRSVMHGLALIR